MLPSLFTPVWVVQQGPMLVIAATFHDYMSGARAMRQDPLLRAGEASCRRRLCVAARRAFGLDVGCIASALPNTLVGQIKIECVRSCVGRQT